MTFVPVRSGGSTRMQQVVVRRDRMEHREGVFPVAVEARRLRGHHEEELAAVAGLVLGRGGQRGGEGQRAGENQGNEPDLGRGQVPPPASVKGGGKDTRDLETGHHARRRVKSPES